MKKVYITPTIFFDEVLDSEELLQLSKNTTSDLTGGGAQIGDDSTIKGDGGQTTRVSSSVFLFLVSKIM